MTKNDLCKTLKSKHILYLKTVYSMPNASDNREELTSFEFDFQIKP
jgi:hypothetical protein